MDHYNEADLLAGWAGGDTTFTCQAAIAGAWWQHRP